MKKLISFFRNFTKKKNNKPVHAKSIAIRGKDMHRENPLNRKGF